MAAALLTAMSPLHAVAPCELLSCFHCSQCEGCYKVILVASSQLAQLLMIVCVVIDNTSHSRVKALGSEH
jgi:hypothetical protein